MTRRCLLAIALAAGLASSVGAQTVTQKGFLDLKAVAYPQQTTADDTQATADLLIRHEASARPVSWLKAVGAVDLRADTHQQTAWKAISWSDRDTRRPLVAVRRLDVTVNRGAVTFSAGKQFIRWGKTDLVNPTDRFAPRDFVTVFDNEYVAVTSARLTAGSDASMFDLVVARFTPSRIPLIGSRWSGTANEVSVLAVEDGGALFPTRPQLGLRWSHVGSGYEMSLSAFTGNNHMPLVAAAVVGPSRTGALPSPGLVTHIEFTRRYPEIRMLGGDVAVPTAWLVVKGEVAYITSPDATADEFVLYVVQAERQLGEWLLVAGYAGEAVTTRRTPSGFAFDRSLTKAVLARASYTIDANRSAALDAAVRQDGSGSWLRAECSQGVGQHLRVTAQATWIRGDRTNFFGRYNRNSNLALTVRYSY
jgi:hypothetical protein